MLFILFQLGEDRYALPATAVTEVLPLLAIKALPGAPAGVAGLVNYRGAAVPVVDLAALALGRPAARRVSTRLLLVNYTPPTGGESRLLGLLAEHATETLKKNAEDFQPVAIANDRARFLGPVASDRRGLIQRIEIAQLLTAELRAALFPAAEGVAR
ncbi:MAG: hypothetical protein RLZZ15_3382 [Verrucomicrobiota bacterium]|jgi:chemotaxis-related protein WspB